MKHVNFEGLDTEIHRRIYGVATTWPSYSRQVGPARATVEFINATGLYRVYLKQVVAYDADGTPDWQCEIFSGDGLDNLWTEIDGIETLAICRAISGADIRL